MLRAGLAAVPGAAVAALAEPGVVALPGALVCLFALTARLPGR
ncbi:hypothetical protein [Catellatospora vulcania]|nr:hypothetical protein [Catellatospora vulcania]